MQRNVPQPPALFSAAIAVVLGLTLALAAPGPAVAGTRVVFQESFAYSTLERPGSVAFPQPLFRGACLTAQGNDSIDELRSCSRFTAPWTDGKLQLTDMFYQEQGGFFLAETRPGDEDLVTTFTSYQHGTGAVPGDGLAFVVAAVDPAAPELPREVGMKGSALGYSSSKGLHGLGHGYLGFGFDVYGGFSRTGNQGFGCPESPFVSSTAYRPGQVVVRGPGNRSRGYCAVNSTATSDDAPPVGLRSASREGSAVPTEAALNPTGSPITTAAGTAVPAHSYVLTFTPVGGPRRALSGPLPKVDAGLYPASWLDADGYPKQLAYGFVATTGAATDFHELGDVRAVTQSGPDPSTVLSVDQTAHLGPDLGVGDPVSYVLRVRASSGDPATTHVSTSLTLPAGVLPVGGSGSGWDCVPREQQQLRCRQLGGYAETGPALPELVVQGVVTRAGVTRSAIATGSRVQVSSLDALTVTSGTTTLREAEPGPTDLALEPDSGPAGSGTEVHGTGLDGVSLVRIGTDAELSGGTAAALVPCSSGNDTRPCFVGTTVHPYLGVESMPGHAAGPVRVQVMGLGSAVSAVFTYTAAPGAPYVDARQDGTAVHVSWAARGDGGRPITGWTVTPYRDWERQDPIAVPADVDHLDVSDLRVGSEYVFLVAGRNANGVGESGASARLVFAAPPGQPTDLAATAGSEVARLRWTSPKSTLDIQLWVVTPYRDGVRQSSQLTEEDPYPATRVVGLDPGHSYTFTVAARSMAGVGPPSAQSAPVVINARPTLDVSDPLPAATVGEAYRQPLGHRGGTAPLRWSVSAGDLPDGLALDPATGVLSGTPRAAGDSTFTVRLADEDASSTAKVHLQVR